MKQAKLGVVVIPPFRIKLSSASAVIPKAVYGCCRNLVNLYADVRFPVIAVAGRFGADFKGEGEAFDVVQLSNSFCGKTVFQVTGGKPD